MGKFIQKWPIFRHFRSKSVLYVLSCISKSKIALEKRISDLESRQNYLSGCCQRFFHQTSSSASKITLKSGYFPLLRASPGDGRRPPPGRARPRVLETSRACFEPVRDALFWPVLVLSGASVCACTLNRSWEGRRRMFVHLTM